MEDEKKNRYGIVPFAGTDFGNWFFRLRVVLEEADVHEEIEEVEEKENPVEGTTKARKCKSIIVQSIADSHLEIIKDLDTPREIIQKLKSTYLSTGIASQLLARKKILTLKYNEKSTLSDFFLDFDKLARQLREAGAQPSRDELICYLLLAMPKAYENVVTAIETINSDTINMEFVRRRLLDEETKKKGLVESESIEVFQARKEKHSPAYRPLEKNSKDKKPFPFECYNCGKKGHMKSECKFKKNRNTMNIETNKQESSSLSFLAIDNEILVSNSVNTIEFVCDSGATDHLVNSEQFLQETETLQNPIVINTAKQGEKIVATKKGKIREQNITVKDVLYVPTSRCNLLSVSKMESAGCKIEFDDRKVRIYYKKELVKEGKRENNLYKIWFKPEIEKQVQKAYSVGNEEYEWHKKLGHASQEKLQKLKQRKLISYENSNSEELCEPCLKGRQTRLPFQEKERKNSNRILELIHSDLCGPVTPTTHDNKKYMLTFIDDYSHFAYIYLIESKTEVLKHFKYYVNTVEAQFGTKISRFRCDNGTEYKNKEFNDYCNEKGIRREFSMNYTPQQNGVSERFNRTLVEKARTLLADSNFNKELWGEAAYTATYIINRLPTRNGIIPAELWFGKSPDYKKLQCFGIPAYVHLQPQYREKGKFEEKSKKYYLVGYCNNGYKLWDTQERKIITARDVIFDKAQTIKKECFSRPYYEEENDLSKIQGTLQPEQFYKIQECSENSETVENKTENTSVEKKRKRKLPSYLSDYEVYHSALSCIGEPNTLQEALESEEKEYWKDAMKTELESHEKHQTWTRVERPKDKKVIDSRWVFKKKENIYKARLVAKGFQNKDYEDTYSPVGRVTTLRVLLTLANQECLHVQQMDVKTAFLHGHLQEEIYMNLPGENGAQVCKLNRSIYGLKQSPRCWNEAFHSFMLKNNFKVSKRDSCLYVQHTENREKVYLFLYVDDILLICKSEQKISEIKSALSKNFDIVDLGSVKKFLGIEIERDFNNKKLVLHQKSYIQNVLNKFGMIDCKSASTPCEVGLKLEKPDKFSCKFPYRELIGCLIYLVICTRPDLSYAVSYFSQFQNNACDEHYTYLKRVLRYLKSTADYGLFYECNINTENIALGYCDADWGTDNVDRKSISGYCFLLYNNIVSWCTQKQKTVSLSSAEAEYMALSLACCEAVWFKGLLFDMGIECKTLTICEDNQSCIHIAKNRENSRRVKHIDIKHHFIRDLIEEGQIILRYVQSSKQLSDIFTKALCKPKFEYLRNLLNIKKC